jgi:hypothetical protein
MNKGKFVVPAMKSPESRCENTGRRAAFVLTETRAMEIQMSPALTVPLALVLMGFFGYHWLSRTVDMIADARQSRMKRHLDWTVVQRRGLSKSNWRFW